MKKLMFAVLAFSIMFPIALELLLTISDPWGVARALGDHNALAAGFIPDELRGYRLRAGIYRASNWSATITEQGTRWLPDTNINAPCEIVLLGDSGTFGVGVGDAQTWANLLAKQYPMIHLINPAVSGYNIDNMLGLLRAFPHASGYLYLMIDNDADPSYPWNEPIPSGSMISVYWWWWQAAQSGSGSYGNTLTVLPGHFHQSLTALLNDNRVVAVAFDGAGLSRLAHAAAPVNLIPGYTHRISKADPHPDAIGHQEIARNIAPYFEHLVSSVCRES